MSRSEVADGAVPDARQDRTWPVRGEVEDTSVTATGTARQPTGDHAVDEGLGLLDVATDEPLDIQIEVGERVHRVLQARLADLGQE